MNTEQLRAEFEAWIASPPYEKPVTINPETSGFPGQYRAYEVQLAWEAYQAGRASPVVELPERIEKETGYTEDDEYYNLAIDRCKKAIEAAP